MTNPYTVLGVTADADDTAIRQKYLELTTQYPPEEFPQRSAAIRAAYDRIKDLDARVKYRLLEFGIDDSIESIIEEAACLTPRRRVGLQELLKSAHVERPASESKPS
jgi:DnaJ-class molecular chaperone